jgi:hypothetical protein
MATEFKIEAGDRELYEKTVNDPPDMAERMVRAAIAAWARQQQPNLGVAWMYSWNTEVGYEKTDAR